MKVAGYKMFYSYDTESSILRIAVLVQTTGWIGLGISPNGQMPGSDVVMGWVDRSGQALLQVITIIVYQVVSKMTIILFKIYMYIHSYIYLLLYAAPFCSSQSLVYH